MRDRPHILVLARPTRCCLDCFGQTTVDYPAEMPHESTCRRVRNKLKTWSPPTGWRERIGEAEAGS